jgi:hypothetical protein
MDDIWSRVIISSFAWAIFAILVVLMPVIIRKWRRRK